MKVSLINNYVTTSNKSTQFQGKKSQEKPRNQNRPQKASSFVTIPAALFMTLSPSLLNAQEPVSGYPISAEIANKGIEIVEENPFYLQDKYLRYEESFEMDGKDYGIYYSDIGAGKVDDNRVVDVYVKPSDFNLVKYHGLELNSPMKVEELVVHRPEEGGFNFMGTVVSQSVYNEEDNTSKIIRKEIRLPEKISFDLLDLFLGVHKDYYMADSRIDDVKVSTSDDIMSEEVVEPKPTSL